MRKRKKSKGFKPVTLRFEVTRRLDCLKSSKQSYSDVIEALLELIRALLKMLVRERIYLISRQKALKKRSHE